MKPRCATFEDLPYRQTWDHERGSQYQIDCAECGAADWISASKHLPSERVIKKFRQKYWDVPSRGTRALCPKCIAAKKAARAEDDPMAKLSVVDNQGPAPLTRKHERDLYGLLDAHFDEKAGRYRGGFTDARVAEELGIAVRHVRQVRDEAYGPLKAPKELIELQGALRRNKDDIEDLRAMVADLGKKHKQMALKVDVALSKY